MTDRQLQHGVAGSLKLWKELCKAKQLTAAEVGVLQSCRFTKAVLARPASSRISAFCLCAVLNAVGSVQDLTAFVSPFGVPNAQHLRSEKKAYTPSGDVLITSCDE